MVTAFVALTALLAAATGASSQTPAPAPHTRAETLALVRKDVATRDRIDAATLVVVREEDRTWDDAGLGCGARKGLREPSPVAGYSFLLRAGERTWEYHSDRMGRIKRCPPVKPGGH